MRRLIFLFLTTLTFISPPANAQHSVARQWNDVMLEAIRKDYARPTVHARNLFHVSLSMYDAFAVYDNLDETYFLGKTIGGYTCDFNGISKPASIADAQEKSISYAAYRILSHRFSQSPGSVESQQRFDALFENLGYDNSFTSIDYSTGSAAALGNYIAECIINFGFQDGSQEQFDYRNFYYSPINDALVAEFSGNSTITDPNRWQPLTLEVFIDQAGNVFTADTPDFLSPEWGFVTPFSLKDSDLNIYNRDENEYWVYHDPGSPPVVDSTTGGDDYKWGFSLVSKWSSQLDPSDGVMIDISPSTLGNIQSYPTTTAELRDFYDEINGGDPGLGHEVNPNTGLPYEQQLVPRGDYTRVLAEFWADGPDSETPPGHWFTILNYVNDHPDFEKKFKGEGPVLGDLRWDVRAYLLLAGAMHDSAITAWGIKGYYDYIRPISAIRFMCDQGQSTDMNLTNFSPAGMPLSDGTVELVEIGDPLAGDSDEHVGKVKLKAWKGPGYIIDPTTDVAGVDWILGENWWPYQRPTFITPPFAGYISGHSVFSRAAADIMTKLTGDPFFPGGLGEFIAKKNEFLVFENGPSVDIKLQWATYQDASDQTSLSRILGGIHPPADDVPGRLIGIKIANDAFSLGESFFGELITGFDKKNTFESINIYPNPSKPSSINIAVDPQFHIQTITLYDIRGTLYTSIIKPNELHSFSISTSELNPGIYVIQVSTDRGEYYRKVIIE